MCVSGERRPGPGGALSYRRSQGAGHGDALGASWSACARNASLPESPLPRFPLTVAAAACGIDTSRLPVRKPHLDGPRPPTVAPPLKSTHRLGNGYGDCATVPADRVSTRGVGDARHGCIAPDQSVRDDVESFAPFDGRARPMSDKEPPFLSSIGLARCIALCNPVAPEPLRDRDDQVSHGSPATGRVRTCRPRRGRPSSA